jgi:AraC-like DNA-binding protein
MLAHDYFTLKLVKLNSAGDWSFKQEGLCILLAKGGAGRFGSGPATQRLAAGDVLVVNGAAQVRLNPLENGEMIFWCFSLRLDQLYPLFTGGEISLLEGVADSFSQPRHFPATRPLAKQCHRLVEEISPEFNLDHRSQLLRVASLILTEEFKTLREQHAGSLGVEAHLIQTFERLSTDELLTISVGDLAAKFSCSRRHLNRLFHQYFGFSVASLRMEMRLLKAVSLLRNATAKVINVAEQCGFNHLGLFNTCFKRRFGVSPGQWRKEAAKGPTAPASAVPQSFACPMQSKGLCPLTAPAGALRSGPAIVPVTPAAASGALRPPGRRLDPPTESLRP